MSVFGAAYADQYDSLYVAKDYRQECNLIDSAVQRFAKFPTKSIVDIGCGTGGHALELAQRGYEVVGVDQSSAMIERAKVKSAAQSLTVSPHWLCADARDFDAGQEFDMALMMFAVIGYLNENDDVLACLKNIRRQLKKGGLFICDFWYGPSVLSMRPTDRVKVLELDQRKIIRSSTTILHPEKHTADVTFDLWTIDQNSLVDETREHHRLRYFFPQEFLLFLSVAGFGLRSLSAFPSLEQALAEDTWNALVVAEAL